MPKNKGTLPQSGGMVQGEGSMKRYFVMFVVAAMIGGFIAGMIVHGVPSPAGAVTAAGWFDQVTNIFLRLIKMIIAPLVLTTLTSGIGHIESAATVGRIGTKAMIWFLSASFVALVIGLVMVNLLQPGVGAGVAHVAASASPQAGVGPAQELLRLPGASDPRLDLRRHGAERDSAGGGVLDLRRHRDLRGGPKGSALLHVIEQGATVILKITTYVMMFAPLAIFAAIAGAVSTQGIGIIVTYAKLVGDFYLSLRS